MSRPLPNNPPPSLTMQFANMGLQDQQQQWSPSPLPAPPQPSPTRSGFQQQQQRERDHPQMHSFIHPQARAITQRHPQAQMIHQQWQQQQQQQQQQQRIPRSTGFQQSSPVRAGPSSPYPPSYENRQTFTPTSSFPNGIPPGGIPGANALAQQPPRPPSMAGSYSQPVPQQHTLPRPPSMAPTSYSQPAPPRPSPGYNQFPPPQAAQQPQIFVKPPLHPASPTRSQYSLPHTEPVAFPPPPVHPDSPTRRTRELSPVRQQQYQIEQRVASSQPASRNTSPQRPMSIGQFPMHPQPQPVRQQSSFTNEQRTFPQPVSRNNQPPRPASISQFPPSPVSPHSPVRHNSYQTEQRSFPQPGSRDVSPQRQTNNAHFPPSVPAPTPPTRRDTSPHRELPTPGSVRPSAHQPQTQTQRPVPTSSFPQGTTPSAVSQAQQSLMGRAFPQPPTANPSRPLPSMQYSGPPPAQTQMPPNSFPRSRPTQPAPTIREPSPTRPIRLPNLDDPAPQPVSPHIRGRSPSSSRPASQAIPQINFPEPPSGVPMINFPDDPQPPRARQDAAVPKIVIPDDNIPQINFGSYEDNSNSPSQNSASSSSSTTARFDPQPTPSYSSSKANGLACARCRLVIVGRMVSSGGPNGSLRWHPACFACIVCGELLEHVSSYERNGNMYCHLDYHEKFAPPCSHCQTPIIDEEYICLDEPGLGGQRSYHAQHFFCAECGDPFLQPGQDLSSAEYIIHKGYPYCEACHVRLRMPLCKRKGCGKRIREWESGVDALGGKWCTGCFRCAGCDTPLGERYYDRDGGAYCQDCFSIILRNDL